MGNLCQCSVILTVKMFLHVEGEALHEREALVFQFVPVVACPVTGNHWKEPVIILFASSIEINVNI